MSAQDTKRQTKVEEILQGAELLIEYSSRNAMAPEGIDETELQKLFLRVAKVRAAVDSTGLSEEDEAQFFCDFRILARTFLPVTVGSIRDSVDNETSRYRQFFWWGSRISSAAASVRNFVVCSVAALALLLFVQIIWLIGYDLFDQMRTFEKEEAQTEIALRAAKTADVAAKDALAKAVSRREDAERKVAEVDAAAAKAGKAHGGNAAEGAEEKSAEQTSAAAELAAAQKVETSATAEADRARQAQSEIVQAQVTRDAKEGAVIGLLTWWVHPLSRTAGNGDSGSHNKSLVVAKILITVLQTYLLPLLYGFLGTCAYVLRQLTIETRARTFRHETEISYWLRIFLGILAGLAIGWFLRPESDKDGMIRGLTPFALSFLAGYSVEVLFAGMDRLVSAFGSPQAAGTKA